MNTSNAPLILNLIGVPVDSLGGLQRTARDVERVLSREGYRVRTICPEEFHRFRSGAIEGLVGHLYRWRSVARLVDEESLKEASLVIGHTGAGWGLPAETPRLNMWQNESGEYANWTWPKWHPNYWKLKTVDTHCERRAGTGAHNYAVSERLGRNLADNAGLHLTGVIENAVDTDHFKPLAKDASDAFRARYNLPARTARVLLYSGRPVNYKGLWLLRDWAAEFADQLHIAIAGPDTLPPELANLPNVSALGRIGYEELPELYASADFFALPSRHEGCSYSVMEAMACGVPSLLSDAGHVRTIVKRSDELRPWIAPTSAPEELTPHLRRWLEDPAIAESLTEHSREYVLKFHSMERFQSEWADAVERHRRK